MSGRTHIDLFQNGQNKDVQGRVPPPHDHTPKVRPGQVGRPEYTHQAIMLWHVNQQARGRSARKSPAVLVVLWPICRIRSSAGAGVMISMDSRPEPSGDEGEPYGRTRLPSRVARRSTGMKMRTKTRLRTAKPLVARDCAGCKARLLSATACSLLAQQEMVEPGIEGGICHSRPLRNPRQRWQAHRGE